MCLMARSHDSRFSPFASKGSRDSQNSQPVHSQPVISHGLPGQWAYNAPYCRLTPSGTLTLSQREKEPHHRRARRMEYKVISGDGHIDLRWLPHDLFVSHAPAQWKDQVPQVRDTPTGKHWFAEGRDLTT